MKLSTTTILAPIPGRPEVFAVQPLTGQAAILGGREAGLLQGLRPDAPPPPELPMDALREGGFVVDGEDQDREMLAEAYAGYLTDLDRTPTQLIVVPSFGCNLRCTYCYQEVFDPKGHGLISDEAIAALFTYIDRFHGSDDPRPYITLFGGEPLIDTPAHHDRVGRILDGAAARGIEVAAVTNGYDLTSFVEQLRSGPVKEVQVTLDGPEAVHDLRRPHAKGHGTFERVVEGIQGLVDAGIPVNLRVVVDAQNLDALPALARFVADRGWLDLPDTHWKTQIGRNYELFGCASRQRRADLLGRTELWERYVALTVEHPELRRFHSPRFHGVRHLAETGELPAPNFDACPAAKKEWAFTPDGGLYGCTATVGNPKYRLGRFYPEIERDDAAMSVWQGRNVFTIPDCQGCALTTVCGGGCGAIASDRTGSALRADCRPVREAYGLGAAFYGLVEEEPHPGG